MTNLDKLKKQLQSVETEISRLSNFRDTPSLRRFIRILQGEASHIREQISHQTQTKQEREKLRSEKQLLANKNRSEKMKRTWRYLRAIKANYPVDLSIKELRSALRKHRQGLETDIPDVAWGNPSP